MHALLLPEPSPFTEIAHDRKFFGNHKGSKPKPQQSTLAFKETEKLENTKGPGQNGIRQARKHKVKDESEDSNSDQEAHSTEEPDSPAPRKGGNETSKKPEIVSEALSNDECGSHRDMILTSTRLP